MASQVGYVPRLFGAGRAQSRFLMLVCTSGGRACSHSWVWCGENQANSPSFHHCQESATCYQPCSSLKWFQMSFLSVAYRTIAALFKV